MSIPGTFAREPVSPRVRSEVVHIEMLFYEIDQGDLRVPRFHRPFVWKPDDMISLFDSIARDYPIGSLLIWQTNEDIQSRDWIGPIPIPPPRRGDAPVSYILDGQQRLSTLYGVLRLGALHPQGPRQSDWRWWIYYDLAEKQFLHLPNAPAWPQAIPLRALLRTVDFLKEAQRLQMYLGETASRPLLNQAQLVAQRIQSHQLAVTRIHGGSIAHAVEIFARLNTSGQPMTADQMMSALTYRGGADAFDLSAAIDRILEGLRPFNFDGVDRTIILRSIGLSAGVDFPHTKGNRFAEELRRRPGAVDEADLALRNAASFLATKLGVPDNRLLPYALQFVFLAEFFRRCPSPGPTQVAMLCRWFWATSFSGWFAGVSPTQIRLALEGIRSLADGAPPELAILHLDDACRPFPRTFDLHSARLRTFILFTIQRLKPRSIDGVELEAADIFFEQGSRAFAHVFRNAPADLVSRTANRIILPVRRGRPAKKQLLEDLAPEDEDAVLLSHGINEEAREALVNDDAATFIEAREKHLVQLERAFMAELGLTPSVEELGESDIDTGDD